MKECSWIRLAFPLLLVFQHSRAIVISAPEVGRTLYPQQVDETRISKTAKVRIRSTQEEDISSVAHILARAVVDPCSEHEDGFNFKIKMEVLKTKVGIESLLSSRVKAMNTGNRLLDIFPREISEADRLRLLWANDGFRSTMEKAAKLSTEPHIWERHNFSCPPESSCWLQHKMITAEDLECGSVIGFCELAMLAQPSSDHDTCCPIDDTAPTMVNLVISPEYRRQGVASRLMKAASRFVQEQWISEELTLYVDKQNLGAVAMYRNFGFELTDEVESTTRSQWYMSKELADVQRSEMSLSI